MNDTFPIARFTGEGHSGAPQLSAHASASPFGQKEGSDLANMSHGREDRRPDVESLNTNDALQIIDGEVDRLARRERLQVVPLLRRGPCVIDGGMDALRRNHLKEGGNSACVCRERSPYGQK